MERDALRIFFFYGMDAMAITRPSMLLYGALPQSPPRWQDSGGGTGRWAMGCVMCYVMYYGA